MPKLFRPEDIIGEVLGVPADRMRDPVGADYQCPFLNGQCVKRAHHIVGPYPVCSVRRKTETRLIATCPKRFLGVDDLVGDVIKHCWPGDPPLNPRVAYEVRMEKFGQVDLVIADFDEATHSIRQFVSVELQAVDTSNSVEPAYTGLINNVPEVAVNFGINWGNVRKRYMTQLVEKSFYHNQWGTRMVAVMQTPLYEYLRGQMQFAEILPGAGGIDVAFLLYDYVDGTGDEEDHSLMFDRVVGTSHGSLMTSALYQQTPPRAAFTQRILARLTP